MQITVSDYQFIKRLVSQYQRVRINVAKEIREDLKNEKTTFTFEDLDRFETLIEEIYIAGSFADRLEAQINQSEHESTNN
jgi:phage protein D